MPYKLSDKQINELIARPESGMGYQYVEATMSNYLLQGIVLNAEIFIPNDKLAKIIGKQFLLYSAILIEAESSGYIQKLTVISKRRIIEEKNFTKSVNAPALEAAITYTGKNNNFKRFTPFSNDHRITSDGRLLAGSYATTEEDARNVRTGIDATLRYALPSDEPAVYVFTIMPPERSAVRVGTVQPAYNKPGGGIEVIFVYETPKRTVTGPDKIPER